MVRISIDQDRCKGCCLCVSECPLGIIAMSDQTNTAGNPYAVIIEQNKCTGCGLCCQMCPDRAIEIEKGQ